MSLQYSKFRVTLLASALGFIALFYYPTTHFQFVNWDDRDHVYGNPAVVGKSAISMRDRLLTPELGYPIPVTVFTYRLENRLFGLDPHVFHATNVIIHLASCFLVFLMARTIGLGFWGALISMSIFAIHPVVAEPVSWVSGRKDLLALFFSLLASWLVASRGICWKRWTTVFIVLLYLSAVFSKPTAVFLPLFWGALLFVQNKSNLRTLISQLWIFFLISGLVIIGGFFGQSQVGAAYIPGSSLTWLRNAWYSFCFHLQLLLFAHSPLPKHMAEEMPPPFEFMVDLFPVLVFGAWFSLRKLFNLNYSRAMTIALSWASISYLPSSNLVPITRFLADSYVYFPLVGFAWFMGGCFECFASYFRKAVWRVCGIGLICVGFVLMMMKTMQCVLYWRDSVEVWRPVYEKYPDRPYVCVYLADSYSFIGDYQKALNQYEICGEKFGRDEVAPKIDRMLRQLRK